MERRFGPPLGRPVQGRGAVGPEDVLGEAPRARAGEVPHRLDQAAYGPGRGAGRRRWQSPDRLHRAGVPVAPERRYHRRRPPSSKDQRPLPGHNHNLRKRPRGPTHAGHQYRRNRDVRARRP
jgi:hypothetical protein